MTTRKLFITLALGVSTFWGCSDDSSTNSDNGGENNAEKTELEGVWTGTEVNGASGEWKFDFSENKISVVSANPNEWYKGTFTINHDTDPKQLDFTITDAPVADYKGLSAKAIYKIDENTMTFAGNQPGSPIRPLNFEQGPQSNGSETRVYIINK